MSDEPPKDYLVLAILAYLLCCPIGSAAMYYSSQTRRHNYRDEPELAAETSETTFVLSVIAISLGCIGILNTWIVIVMTVFAR
ncbi:unnamed protein product [Gulo gulo]|uniref:Uncharacterized protein n=1 Tax=Gulo gulo TaxID=48420 RepID=A0A9X9LYS9_GULGU|nr:unnamed protein product [Gulo gulo]